MTLSDLAIRRPVLAAVASLLIVVFGVAALRGLPVRELPDVDDVVVSVATGYVGAAPEVVDTDITQVIEGAVAGIAGIETIRSSSRRGRSSTTITFATGRDIDEAANDVRDAVSRVRDELPDDADEPRVEKADDEADPVMRVAVTSDRLSAADITDFVERVIVDRLATIEGVASVEIYGQRRFAIRIWLDRRALAARNLTVADIDAALRRNNVELPAGEIRSAARQFAVRLDSRLQTIDEFRSLVVSEVDGYQIRLADVAEVELGVEDDQTRVRSNGVVSVGMGVLRQSKANILTISEGVREELERLRPTLPEGMNIVVGSDDALFVAASIREVVQALFLSLALVVTVIFVFLASFRATLIPLVTIPVSLIGAFVAMNALGFSINVLTLLALLLAIGLVVDDAIVVLENVQRRIDLGEHPLVAAYRGSRQVTFAVVATSMTLIAVFVPLSFLDGPAGRLFVEFGFVMAAAVIISTFVALTASPALASKVLVERSPGHLAGRGPGRLSRSVEQGYRRLLRFALAAPLPVIATCLLVAFGAWQVFLDLPRELAPREDRGRVFVPLTAPEGSTVSYTDAQARLVEEAAAPLVEDGSVETVLAVAGSRGRPNRAFIVVRLAPWNERSVSDRDVAARLRPAVTTLPGANGFPITPTGLGLRSSSEPLRVVVLGPDHAAAKRWAEMLQERAEANPGLGNVRLDFEENQPELKVRIDRARADDLEIAVDDVALTLQTLMASREITNWVDRGREYSVIVQGQADDRQTPADLTNIFVRAGDGTTLVPLGALVTVDEGASAPRLLRFDRLPAVTLRASLVDGYDLGSAIAFIDEAARESLPDEARTAFTGPSRTYLETASGVAITFALALLIVYLVLAAQFESFVHPLIIMLSVPLAMAGAIYALWFAGASLNLYSQIGVILLVGLMAKNGILIVEFANQLRDEGLSVREAVSEAAALRLRPIVMTVLSTILGAVPLVLATGAGAEARTAIGTVIIGGLSLSAILTLFLTPVLYDLLARFTRPGGATAAELEGALGGETPR